MTILVISDTSKDPISLELNETSILWLLWQQSRFRDKRAPKRGSRAESFGAGGPRCGAADVHKGTASRQPNDFGRGD